jgi:hypothetical protein
MLSERRASGFSIAIRGCINIVGATAVALLVSVRSASTQPCSTYTQIAPPTQSIILTMKTTDNSCTLTNSGYVRTRVDSPPPSVGVYKIDVDAEIGGSCQVKNGACQNLWVEYRYIRITSLDDPDQIGSQGSVSPANLTVFGYHTATGTNTSSQAPEWYSYTEGTHTITSSTGALPTGCNFSQPIAGTPITVHVMQCKPEWFLGGEPGNPIVNFHGPASGDIKIRIPSSAFERRASPCSTSSGRLADCAE